MTAAGYRSRENGKPERVTSAIHPSAGSGVFEAEIRAGQVFTSANAVIRNFGRVG